jgi:hypothetical protein
MHVLHSVQNVSHGIWHAWATGTRSGVPCPREMGDWSRCLQLAPYTLRGPPECKRLQAINLEPFETN